MISDNKILGYYNIGTPIPELIKPYKMKNSKQTLIRRQLLCKTLKDVSNDSNENNEIKNENKEHIRKIMLNPGFVHFLNTLQSPDYSPKSGKQIINTDNV